MITHRDRAFLLEHLDEVKRILCHEADDAHLLSIIKPRSSGKEIEMSDCRWLFRRHWLGIALLQAVGVVACGGAQTGAPVPDMEAEAMPAGLTSDFVSRPLPNPTSEVILNWAPLPDGRGMGDRRRVSTLAPMITFGRTTGCGRWPGRRVRVQSGARSDCEREGASPFSTRCIRAVPVEPPAAPR